MRPFITSLLGLVIAMCLGTGAIAQEKVQALVRQLQAQGYSQIEVKRTWLGRYRIEAKSGNREREIIMNENTGEVLRDYAEDDDDHDDDHGGDRSGRNSGSGSGNSGSGSGNSGSGSHGGDDDGDDHGGDDGDNSGHGSGGDDGDGDD